MSGLRWFSGASGRRYNFTLVAPEHLGTIPYQAGNFIFARVENDDLKIAYVGDTSSIVNTIFNTTIWNIARKDHKVTQIYFGPQSDPEKRDETKRDLVDQWHPPMNDPDKAV